MQHVDNNKNKNEGSKTYKTPKNKKGGLYTYKTTKMKIHTKTRKEHPKRKRGFVHI